MLRKKQRPMIFTRGQSQQLRYTTYNLCMLNRIALRQLQRVAYSDPTTYREASTSLANVTTMMNSALQLREQIVNDAREPKNMILYKHYRTRCEYCQQGPSRVLTNDGQTDLPEALKQDPAWRTEIEFLLKVVNRIQGRWIAHCTSRGAPQRAFFIALSRLANALLRQRRHLQKIAPEPTIEIKVLEEFGQPCDICGRPTRKSAEKQQNPVEGTEESGSEVAPESNARNESTMGESHEQ